jgi:hypothetical protein
VSDPTTNQTDATEATGKGRPWTRAGALLRRIAIDMVVAGLAVAVGAGSWALVGHLRDGGDGYRAAHNEANAFEVRPAPMVALPQPATGPVAAPAAGGAAAPEAAVDGFLRAEVAADFEASYAFLSAADRDRYRIAAAWVAAHGALPSITGYAVDASSVDGAQASVTARTDLLPAVDLVKGIVAAHGIGHWVAVQEDGRWWVSFRESSVTPVWPSDALAPEAVSRWVAARQGCDTPAEFEGLLGVPGLADELCGAAGTVDVRGAERLEAATGAPIVAAFGDVAGPGTRVVDVRAPVPMRAVVAADGDGWLVVGVLAPTG